MVNLTATKALSYGGVRYKPGDEFDAPRKHARVLIAIGKAEKAPEVSTAAPEFFEPVSVQPIQAVDQADDLLGADTEVDNTPADAGVEISPRTGRPKRQYRRRDVTAEPNDSE